MSNWSLASCKELHAYRVDDQLIIVARGEKPTPCYEVKIEQLPTLIEPPEFAVMWWSRPGICPQIVVPYRVVGRFPWKNTAKEVAVHCREGKKMVKIEPAPDVLSRQMSLSGGGDIPTPFAKIPAPFTQRDEGIGYSDSFSFEEAFHNAINSLPPEKPSGVADGMTVIHVVDTGAEFGGFLGLHRMFVRVVRFSQ